MVTQKDIERALNISPYHEIPKKLPKDPFKRISETVKTFLPPCHPNLTFLSILYAALFFHIINRKTLHAMWESQRTQEDPLWGSILSVIDFYLSSLPIPSELQLIILLRKAYEYQLDEVSLQIFI